MLAIFDKALLAGAVGPAMPTVSVSNTITVIEGILLEFRAPSTVVLTTFDMDKGMRTEIEADVREEGSAILNAQKLYQIIRAMPDGDIRIKIDDAYKVTISGGLAVFELKSSPGSAFPALPELDGDRGFGISQRVFGEYINKVAFSAAANDPRAALRSCYFRLREQISDDIDSEDITGEESTVPVLFTVVTCDGRRLARCEGLFDMTNVKKSAGKLNLSFMVPAKTVVDFTRIVRDTDDEMRVLVARRHVVFFINEFVYFCRLVDAEFMDYERIIAIASPDKSIDIGAAELRRSLERAALVTEDKLAGAVRSSVRLHIENDVLSITSSSPNGSIHDELRVHQEGEPITIGFNCRFLLDALKMIPDIPIRIQLKTAGTGVSIIPGEGEEGDWFFFIMPVTLSS